MIATRPHQIRILWFRRMSNDLHVNDRLLGLAMCTVNGIPFPEVLVYRLPDRRLSVALPVCSPEFVFAWEAQSVIARKVKRYVRRLEGEA